MYTENSEHAEIKILDLTIMDPILKFPEKKIYRYILELPNM